MLLLGAPRLPFNAQELQDIRKYIEDGGACMIMTAEGGESKLNTNINAMLEQVGISVNTDSVIRKAFHKYFHPKHAYVANGCLNEHLVKSTAGRQQEEQASQGQYSKKYRDTKDDLAEKDVNGGLKFVYPFGASINVRKPSQTILSTGPISFPANRPVSAFYMSPRRGKLVIMGSIQFFHDEFFEKEDNQKIQEGLFRWMLNDEGSLE